MSKNSYYVVVFGNEGKKEQIDLDLKRKCLSLLKEYNFKLKNLGDWGCPWYFIDFEKREYIPGRPGVCYGNVIGEPFVSVDELNELLINHFKKRK